MKWPARGSLIWRLYALGLVQLVLLAAAVLFVGYLLRSVLHPEPVERDVARRGPPLAAIESGAPAPSAPTEHRPGPRPHAGPGGPGFGPPDERRGPPPGLPWGPLLTFFASGVLIVGVGSVLSWRWMAHPLAQLSGVARSLGAGDLKARAGMTRSDELGDLGRGFDDMAERIEGLVLTQKELLANVSHELRTPLARIRVALDIASEGDAGAARNSLEEIAVDLGELEHMIDDILTTTRMDLQSGAHKATGFPLRPVVVAPGSIAQRASERFGTRYPERVLNVSVAEALPEIHVDATLFRRVIDNLLDNAHKYSPDGARISLEVSNGGGAVVFDVVDQGMGISERDLARVFEPFFRAERSRSRGTGGVGLGLTLAKRIVEAHGGRIELSSDARSGTRARVSVPPATG
ncbi:MAG TPA: HAMP domain-containing sensor histidine kinase [Polyangiaceae bacterium]|nr:HAMP domain-containing sensor histidine kinase [Polyangiaceae bacterium]